MAQYLPEPDTRHIRAERGVQDDTAAQSIGALSSLFSTFEAGVTKKREEETVLARGEAIGGVTESLIDLDTQRMQLQQEDADIQAQIAQRTNDDEGFDAEDEKWLRSVQSQVDRLDKSKKAGLLNSTSYNIRRNSLWKESLNNIQHLGMQASVNQLFGSTIGRYEEGPSAAQVEVSNRLDVMYGRGQWGTKEQAQLAGQQLYVQQKTLAGSSTLSNLAGSVANISSSLNDGPAKALLSSIASSGGMRTDESERTFKFAVSAQMNQAREQLNGMVSDARASGQILDQQVVDGLYDDLAAEEAYWLTTFYDSLEDHDTQKQAEKALELRQTLTNLDRPMSAVSTQGITTGGVAGVGGQNAISEILSDGFARRYAALLPPEAEQGANMRRADELVQNTLRIVEAISAPGVSLADLVRSGEANPALLTMATSSAVKNGKAVTGAAFAKNMLNFEGYKATAQISDNGAFIEGMDSIRGKAQTIAAQARSEHGDMKMAKESVTSTLRAQLLRVSTTVKDWVGAPEIRLQENDDGSVTPLFIQTVPDEVFNDANAFYRRESGEKMVRKLTELYSEYARYGLVDIEDLQQIAEQFRYGPREQEAQSAPLPDAILDMDFTGEEDGVYAMEDGTQFALEGGQVTYVG